MTNQSYLTKKNVANRLQISVRTLEHLMADGLVPFLKFRHTVRFAPSVFDRIEQKHEKVAV